MQHRRPVEKLREHPQAGLVPVMAEIEFAAFCTDIAAHGVEQPLEITAAGVVLDGRHRLRAARQAGQTTVPIRIVTPDNALLYMLRCALQRRHLSASQRAALALDIDEHALAAARSPRERARDVAARIAGVSARTVQDALTVRAADQTLFEQIKNGELPAHTARREVKRRERYERIGDAPPLPPGRFELIYADPPWQLGNPDSDYAPEQYYPTLPLGTIAELDLPAAPDALLYLWAVNSHLPNALQVMNAWGFEYRACEVWIKPSVGMGVWTRNRHELLLIGRRGSASPAPRRLLLDSVIQAPRTRHSQKPTAVYERLDHLYPGRSKLELFARGQARPGWTTWGNEATSRRAA